MRQVRFNIAAFNQFGLDALLLADVNPQFAAAFLDRQFNFFDDLRIMGYRLLAFADYSNVFGTGVQLTPRIAFSHADC